MGDRGLRSLINSGHVADSNHVEFGLERGDRFDLSREQGSSMRTICCACAADVASTARFWLGYSLHVDGRETRDVRHTAVVPPHQPNVRLVAQARRNLRGVHEMDSICRLRRNLDCIC